MLNGILFFVGGCFVVYFVGLCFIPDAPSAGKTGKEGNKKA